MIQKSYCTTREAAQLLGISVRTAQLWVESGQLEAWKTEGGHRRIARASVNQMLATSKGPAEPAHTPARSHPAPTSEEPATLRVMIVEDNEDLLKLYQLQMRRWPMALDITTATHGYQALLKIGNDPPDLLITDLSMPTFDGFKMLQAIRSVEILKSMVITVVTGISQADVMSRGGLPDDIVVLPKPVPFDRLQKLAHEIFIKKTGAPHT